MRILNGKNKKRFGKAGGVLLGVLLLATACNQETVNIPPYDGSTRTPTDEGETVVNVSNEEYDFYNNYIEFYDGDGDVYDIGDPYVFRYDGKYYLYSSLNGDKKTTGKIPCWVSENLVDWEWGAWVYDPKSTSTTSASYIAFAPEVVYYKGYFYMCESRRGEGHHFFRSESPLGPFELLTNGDGVSNLAMGIDGSFYLADDGQLYFLAAEDSYVNRICYYPIDFVEDAAGGVTVQVDNMLTNIVETAYLDGWTEGPGYFKRNGYGYFTYTGNHVDSANYKVGYSYTSNDDELLTGLSAREQNITLVSSGMDNEAVAGYASKTGNTAVSNYRGLGHASNVVGPNLDSIYTAYHNANRLNYNNQAMNSARKYNVTQYFTNDSYVLTNGLGNYQKTKPETPDYTASASELTAENSLLLSGEATESVFTAELSFRLSDGKGSVVAGYANGKSAKVTVDGGTLTYTSADGKKQTATVPVSSNGDAVHTVKLVNGYKKLSIYYDNMCVLTTTKSISAGKVGYMDGAQPSSTCFTNEAFGSSDFDAVKDLTGSWAAYAYMKGENVGWSLNGGKVKSDGVRQGEAEKTKKVASLDATALTLGANDWVKYTVNAPATDSYALNLLLGKKSRGCIFEVIVDNQVITKMEIPADTEFDDSEYINYQAGSFACEAGLHTMKIRVYGGTLDVVNISTENGGEALGGISDDLKSDTGTFRKLLGSKSSFSPQGLMFSSSDARTLLIAGNQGVADYEMSVDAKIISSGGDGGIFFRMDNYSYTNYSTTQLGDSYRGYYLQINQAFVSLIKVNYGKSETLKVEKPYSEDGFSNGNTVTVTIRCKGGRITVSLNGTEYISVFDSEAYMTGYIGLFATKSSQYLWTNYAYKEI